MSSPAASSRDTGAHRVFHVGNATLSGAVFFAAFLVALVALDPSTSHYLLAERHRPPALHESGAEVVAGFTPVVMDINDSTVLVVPAPMTSSGVNGVSRKLDFFFANSLQVATMPPAMTAAEKTTLHRSTATLSDLFLMLLQREGGSAVRSSSPPSAATVTTATNATAASTVHHRNVLHLCSALACASPFVLQQWSNRGTAAAAVHALRRSSAGEQASPEARSWQRVHNFALVFGEADSANVLTRALTEHHVMVPTDPPRTDDVVAPLVGSLPDLNVVAWCSALSWCRYSTTRKEKEIVDSLQAEADALTTPAAKDRVFREWNRVFAASPTSVITANAPVRQLPLFSLLFSQTYTFESVPFDLVYVDLSAEDSVAAVGFLHSFASAPASALPMNILLCLYPSEWLEDVMRVVEVLEAVGHYKAIPLVSQARAANLVHGAAPGDKSFAQWRALQRPWLWAATYTTPFLSHGYPAQTPLSVVLLSRQFASSAELQHAMDAAASAAEAAHGTASSIDRFLFYSLHVTSHDEADMNALFDDAAGTVVLTTGVSGRVRTVLRFLFQYVYFLIPLTVAGVLIRSLCRPRRSR